MSFAIANNPKAPSPLLLTWPATVDVSPRAQRGGRALAQHLLPSEHVAWQAEAAAAAGVSPSDLLRQAMVRTRTWT